MKQPKRLTRAQKILLSRQGMDPAWYLLAGENAAFLFLVDKLTGIRVSAAKKPGEEIERP